MKESDRTALYLMLREIKSIASHASLTGSLEGSTKFLVDVYNRCLNAIAESDPHVKNLFPSLAPDTADMDTLGAAAALLHKYMTAHWQKLEGKNAGGENGREPDHEDDSNVDRRHFS